jgi:hypothetical protein
MFWSITRSITTVEISRCLGCAEHRPETCRYQVVEVAVESCLPHSIRSDVDDSC